MINDILNGLGVTEVLKPEIIPLAKRSGSSTSSRSTTATADARYTVALPNGQTASNLTQAQYDTIKALLDIYNEAYALAKSNGLSVPNWSEYTKDENAQNALAKLKAQIREKDIAEARAKADAAKQPSKPVSTGNQIIDKLIEDGMEQQVSELTEIVNQHWATPIYKECIEYAKANNFPLPSFQWVESFGYKALPKLKELVAERDRTGINIPEPYAPKVVIPDGVMVSVSPSEEKGSSLLVPGIILALGVIGAIVLVKSKPKRR